MPKTISPIKPWLIQRCKLEDGKFYYDYMGSSEFEGNGQSEALKKLFAGEIRLSQVFVQASAGGAPMGVYLIAQVGFDVTAYQAHLQQLAEGKMRLQESARFNHAVDAKAKREKVKFGADYDIWFDFTSSGDEQNIVLWTLNERKREDLLARLKVVTDAWAANKKSA